MRIALVNPRWAYQGSIYFGCREPHLPLELGYTAAKLEAAGHETLLLDGQLDDVDNATLAEQVADFEADMTVVTTAPTYLFWRCAPPELTSPANFLQLLSERGGKKRSRSVLTVRSRRARHCANSDAIWWFAASAKMSSPISSNRMGGLKASPRSHGSTTTESSVRTAVPRPRASSTMPR
jgi:hypothetical protein